MVLRAFPMLCALAMQPIAASFVACQQNKILKAIAVDGKMIPFDWPFGSAGGSISFVAKV